MIRISQREMDFIQMRTPKMGESSGHATYGIQGVTPKKQEVFEFLWNHLKNSDWGPYYQGGHESKTWFYIEFMRTAEVDEDKLSSLVAHTARKFELELK